MWKKSAWKKIEVRKKIGKVGVQPVFLLTFTKDAVQSRQQAKKQKIHHVWQLRCFKVSARNQLLILLRVPLRTEGNALVCGMAKRRRPLSWWRRTCWRSRNRTVDRRATLQLFQGAFAPWSPFIAFPHCGYRISDFRYRHTPAHKKQRFSREQDVETKIKSLS